MSGEGRPEAVGNGHGPRKRANGYPGGPWAAHRRAVEARAPLVREARRRTRALVKDHKGARAEFLAPALEGNLLTALLTREALQKHGLGKRGARLEWANLMTESSQVISRLLDRLDSCPKAPLSEPDESLTDYLARPAEQDRQRERKPARREEEAPAEKEEGKQ